MAIDKTIKYNLSIDEVDMLTGTLIGRPKSATFRTADVVGLDTMAFVANTGYTKCVDDKERDVFKLPDYIENTGLTFPELPFP